MPTMGDRPHYLREWRSHRHLTQKQVVDRLSALDDDRLPQTEASLSRLENGKQPYNERIMEALSAIYAAETWELIGRDPFKGGEVIDLLAHMSDRQIAQAAAVLKALARDAG